MSDAVYRNAPNALRILVTGGTGTLGEAVLVAFAKAGHHTSFQYFRNDDTAARLTETCGANGFKIDFSGSFDRASPRWRVPPPPTPRPTRRTVAKHASLPAPGRCGRTRLFAAMYARTLTATSLLFRTKA